MVGKRVPAGFLLSGAAELNVDSVNRAAFGIPDCAKDYGIRSALVGRGGSWLLAGFLRSGGPQCTENRNGHTLGQQTPSGGEASAAWPGASLGP